jgi:hypothetical protein
MCRLNRPSFPFVHIAVLASFVALATACSVYDGEIPEPRPDGSGAAGAGAATGGAAGSGAGTGGTSAGAGGASSDASLDQDATLTDATPPPADGRSDDRASAAEAGSPADGGLVDTVPPFDANTADAADAGSSTDVVDAAPPPNDVSSDAASDTPRPPDADATAPADADSGPRDVVDSGPTGPQILPPHGTPIENADAGGPFHSRCASDEVVTGFIGRAGVQTDAIASTCSKLIGGVLSSPRNLPLVGNATGGNAFTVSCPANYVAVSIVGRYGHNTMWMEDVTTAIGVVCKNLTSSATQTVAITGQPALDSGYTTFREDCTGGRYLTDISGRTDGNSLGICVQQVGGECEIR